MHDFRDLVERALAVALLMTALSGIAFGVVSMAGTGAAFGVGLDAGKTAFSRAARRSARSRGRAPAESGSPTIQTTFAPVEAPLWNTLTIAQMSAIRMMRPIRPLTSMPKTLLPPNVH